MRALRKLLRRLPAMAAGILLATGLLELGLRAAGRLPVQRSSISGFHDPDPRLGWIGSPDYSARFVRAGFDVLVSSGRDGFRAPLPGPPPAAADAPRLVVLGDSFVWGYGVSQGESFTDVLQRELGPRARVENRGVVGFGAGQALLLLEERLLADPPEFLLFVSYFNDLFENADEREGRRPSFRLEQGQLWIGNQPVARSLTRPARRWLRHSRAWTHLAFYPAHLRERLGRERAFSWEEAFPLDPQGLAELWELQTALLARMRDRCAAAGVDFRVLRVAPFFELVPPAGRGDFAALAQARFGAELAARCEAQGIPLLDSRQALPDELAVGLRGEPFHHHLDDHWSAFGHERVGVWLAHELAPLFEQSPER